MLRLLFCLEVLCLKLGFLTFEGFDVGFGSRQRFALGQQEVACVAGLYVHDFAHLAQFGHTFQKDNLHVLSPYLTA